MGLKERVDATIDAALTNRIVGCVVLINQGGKQVYARAAGFADREAGKPVRENTIFRLASVTKPIVAATTLKMIDKGLLSLDDKVAGYLPYFTPKAPDGSTPDILIRHLLTHTSGLTYDRPDDVSSGSDPRDLMPLQENLRRFARHPLAFLPGTKWNYGMSIDVLGGVLEIAGKAHLGDVIALHTTGPLAMRDTRFTVTDRDRLAVPYGDGTTEPFRMAEPQGIPNDEGGLDYFSPTRIFHPTAPQSGGSGMAGTAGDFMLLLEAVRTDFFTPATREAALSPQIGALEMDRPGQKFGFLGAVVTDPASSEWPRQGLVQWGGIWGNNWVLDPATGTALVVYTNTMKEGCNGPFRDEMRDAVFG